MFSPVLFSGLIVFLTFQPPICIHFAPKCICNTIGKKDKKTNAIQYNNLGNRQSVLPLLMLVR